MIQQARPVCKYTLCIYQGILPWVANSVYTQGDKSPILKTSY